MLKKKRKCKHCGCQITETDTMCPGCGKALPEKMSGLDKAELVGEVAELVMDVVDIIIN